MISKNLTIGDLIDVPPVQTVIRLEQGKTNPEEIANSFVFTQEVISHFTVIMESIVKKKGGGYFLQGDFGSGKSHFLACLYTTLEFGKTISSLQTSHGGIKRFVDARIKLLPVDISLIKYRSRTSLEQIIILSIENALLERGTEIHLTPLSYFLTWLKKLLEDTLQAEAFSSEFALENRDIPAWIDQHPKDAYRCGMTFIKNQGLSSPELLIEDRHETFSRALAAVREAGFEGIFLIIDELSEFFRSKPDTHSLNEDARTLQYLGELSQEEAIWTIAAVQESIEKTGDIAQSTFRKIKDRFPVKLVLSTLHIRSLISERLITLKPGAEEKLYSIYEEYKKQFTTFSLPFNEFRSVYPVHPATISLLNGLGDLFSVHRGIVDFVHSQIAGDDRRNITGILKRPAIELLAPDSIFDHFENRIAEFSEYHIYPRHILPHLKEIILKTIDEEKDRDMALRLMKILILYKIHPAMEEPNVRELTELVACALFFQNPDMNVLFIAEGILDPLVASSRFLIKIPDPGNEPLNTVYTIVKEDNPGKLLENRIESSKEELTENDSRLLMIPLSELEESLTWPGPMVLNKGVQRTMEWLHSTRKVFIRFIADPDKKTIDEFFYDFRENESDFGLILTSTETTVSMEHVAVWYIPAEEMDRPLFTEYIAVKLIVESLKPGNPVDAPLITLAHEKYRRMQPLIRTSIIDLLYAGKFIHGSVETNPVIRQIKYFDKIIESAGNVLLDLRYPEFRKIAPRRIPPLPRYYQRLLDEFILPGSIVMRDAKAKGLDDSINGLAFPLGLVELKAGTYIFSPDIIDHPLLSTFFSLLKASTHTPLSEVKQILGTKEFGLPETTFFFLITALAYSGLISLLRSNRTMPMDTLSLISVQKADAIAPGELIAKNDREILLKECSFLTPQVMIDSFGLPVQRQVWKSAIKFKETIQDLLSGLSEMLNQFSGYSAFMFFDHKNIEKKTKALLYVTDEIKVSYSAKEGLERYVTAWRGSGLTEEDIGFIKKLYRFLKYQVKSFVFIYHYIHNPEVDKAARMDKDCETLKNKVVTILKNPEALVIEDEGRSLENVFEHFRNYYSKFYIQKHDDYYKSQIRKKISKYARRALNTITALSRIESLDRPPGLASLFKLIDKESEKKCLRRSSEELQSSPFCGCGYHLGDSAEIVPDSPEDIIEAVLASYITILDTPGNCESLTSWAYAIADKDPGMSEQLSSFCKALKDKKITPASLLDFLGEKVIAQCEQAFSGNITILKRDPMDLLALLNGRRLPGNKIREIVTRWLSSEDSNAIFSMEGETFENVKDTHASAAWWPLLHPDIFTPGVKAYDLDRDLLENILERSYPSLELKHTLTSWKTEKIIQFACHERFHYYAIYTSWQVVCDRILGGDPWPAASTLKSSFMNPEKAGEIEHSFALLADISKHRDLPFPQQLGLRIFIDELVSHPHITDELKEAAYYLLTGWEKTCTAWADTLPPVPHIATDDAPVVIILDGVSADIWLFAAGTYDIVDKADVSGWFSLAGPAKTIEAMAALFGFSGDPIDEFHKRDIHYYSLKGNEEQTLPDHILPLPAQSIVIRLNMIDRAGHEGRLRLKEMAASLKTLMHTEIYKIFTLCKQEKRRLIMTVDHGFSLGKKGLSHGNNGVFERIIPYVEWHNT
ncbi:MAG: hypothetical protein JXJ04_03385 [Spirochaetales bacterium]|nr:hypothetical protein [Spirochaetales bacterium]